MARTRKSKVEPVKPFNAANANVLINNSADQGIPASSKIKSSLEVTEHDILNASNSPSSLIELINRLTSSSQDQIFQEYKQKVQAQLDESTRIIEELNLELAAKNAIIDDYKSGKGQTLSSTSSLIPAADQTPSGKKPEHQNLYKSPIRRKKASANNNSESLSTTIPSDLITQDQLSKELDAIGITLDMLELLTGLRITNYEEDDVKFHFDISQTSTAEPATTPSSDDSSLTIHYRLVISKEFNTTAEINYIPTFLKDSPETSERLKEILPEYFCDNLTFPHNTLSQFYTKINRALNKGVK